jgi:4-amino-4-deoxy-L-arabinose transferase-like glycosyltransferase
VSETTARLGGREPAPDSSLGDRSSLIAPRVQIVLLLCVSAAIFILNLGARVLATNDSARFPMLGRDILANGNWLLPRLDGVPHLNKPPLHAWLIALASWPGGTVSEWTASLPSVLAALLVLLLTYWIGWRLFDSEVALVAGLTVVTTYGVFSFARETVPDMVFCAAVTGALVAHATMEFNGRRSALVILYVLVGVAFWTKGPAGFLPLIVVAVYSCATYGFGGLRHLKSTAGAIVLVLLICSWLGLVLLASPADQFLHDVVIRDLLLWYFPSRLPGLHQLSNPPLQTLTILLPWAPLLPGAIWLALRSTDAEGTRRVRWLLFWLGTMFTLFAICHEQRMRYYLPLCPPAALLIGVGYSRLRLPHRAVGFACLWLLAVLGGLTMDRHVRAQYNAETDLRAVSLDLARARHLYALDAPELVFSFYLERPVTVLPSYRDFEQRIQRGGEGGYLIIAEHAVPTALPEPLRLVSTALVNGRRMSVLGDPARRRNSSRETTPLAAAAARPR